MEIRTSLLSLCDTFAGVALSSTAELVGDDGPGLPQLDDKKWLQMSSRGTRWQHLCQRSVSSIIGREDVATRPFFFAYTPRPSWKSLKILSTTKEEVNVLIKLLTIVHLWIWVIFLGSLSHLIPTYMLLRHCKMADNSICIAGVTKTFHSTHPKGHTI